VKFGKNKGVQFQIFIMGQMAVVFDNDFPPVVPSIYLPNQQ